MATAPTPEDSARRILSLFADKGVRAGEILMAGHLSVAFQQDQSYRAKDYEAGLGYGIDHQWFEPSRTAVKLLDAGFAEM